MARFRAMTSGDSSLRRSCDNEQAGRPEVGRRDVLPPISPDIDMARYERLGGVTIRGLNATFTEPALLTARRLRCLLPQPAHRTDADATGRLARYVAIEAQRTGELNYKKIFRRSAVDRYLDHQSRRLTSRTMRTLQAQLYAAGRLVHPQEFPKRKGLAAPHVRRATAASPAEIRDAYLLTALLPPTLASKLTILLDLCYGAGARPGDLKVLRGSSITETTWEGQPVAIVHLPNLSEGTREVPVADPEISARLIALAEAKGPRYLMATGDGEVERNVANRSTETLHERGLESITATSLRNRWVVDLAIRVPAALLLQLADVQTAGILSDQRDQLPTYGLLHATALTKENY
jgi:hypothetical protein